MKENNNLEKLDPIATLETKFAKSSYFIADEIKDEKINAISTGSIHIDQITGINGIPVGKLQKFMVMNHQVKLQLLYKQLLNVKKLVGQ